MPYTIESPLFKKTIVRGLNQLGISFSGAMIDLLVKHAVELLFWNKTTNLTAITDPHGIAVKHMVDSAAALKTIPDHAKVLDLGSGGGFPGIPLKVLKPSLSLVMMDASRKKVSFLKHVIRTLSLDDATAIHGRGEDLAENEDFMGQFDVVISRAFSSLDTFIPMARPFLKKGGVMVAMKGRDYEQEEFLFTKINADLAVGKTPGAGEMELERMVYDLPFMDSTRALLIMRQKKLG